MRSLIRLLAAAAVVSAWSGPLAVGADAAKGPDGDERDAFTATFYTGLSVDTFAVNELENYKNQDDAGDVRERGIAGFDFAFRAYHSATYRQQLWVYGETLHGVRSTDVDCSKTPNIAVCSNGDVADPNAALAIIRNASSLEAFLGLRYEFLRLAEESNASASLYLKFQEGFVSIAGDNKDASQVNSASLGIIATNGRYRGSFIDVGYGTSEYFLTRVNGRYKVDGFLTWAPRALGKRGVGPFAELTADVDLGDEADSITSFIGIDFDLDCLFGCKSSGEAK